MKEIKYPPNVQWEVTSECNHHCIHCYNYWRTDEEKVDELEKKLSENEYLKIAKRIIEQKPVSVVVTGGEPFLVFERVKSSVDLFLENGIKVSFNTNAGLINQNIIDYIVAKKLSLFISFPCSNYAIGNKIVGRKHAIENVIKKLDMCQDNEVHLTFNVVVSTLNMPFLYDTVKFLKNRYNISSIFITRVAKPINSNESFDKYLLNHDRIKELQAICVKIHEDMDIIVDTACPFTPCSLYTKEAFQLFGFKKLCTAGKTTYAVDTTGNIKACPRDSMMYGNILEEQFEEIWKRMKDWRSMSYVPKACKKCSLYVRCLGGCRVDAFPITGKMNELDSVSNPAVNLPLKYKAVRINRKQYKEDDTFFVCADVNYILESNSSIRASSRGRYLYLTPQLHDFLKGHEVFNFTELANAFDINDEEIISNALYTMVYNNIIQETSLEGGSVKTS